MSGQGVPRDVTAVLLDRKVSRCECGAWRWRGVPCSACTLIHGAVA